MEPVETQFCWKSAMLFVLFIPPRPGAWCQGKREWFSQDSFYFLLCRQYKDEKNQTLKNHLKVVKWKQLLLERKHDPTEKGFRIAYVCLQRIAIIRKHSYKTFQSSVWRAVPIFPNRAVSG